VGVGLLMVTILLELLYSSFSSSVVTIIFITLSSNKIQNDEVLVLANPDLENGRFKGNKREYKENIM